MANKILIKNAIVVTMDPERRIIKEGAVAIKGDRIFEVAKTPQLKDFKADKVIDAKGNLVLPGLIDTHVHHYQTLARGLADDVDIIPWCFERIYPYEALVTDEETTVGTLLGCAELIRHGTTTVCDPGGYRVDQIGKALKKSGMRGIVTWMGLDKEPPDRKFPPGFPGFLPTDETLKRGEEVVKAWHGAANGRIRASYGLRVESYISEALYKRAWKLAVRDNVLIQLHAACGPDLTAWMEQTTGYTTIAYLNSIGVLSPHWLFIHMTCVSDDEVEMLRKNDCKVTHNPGASLHGNFGAFTHGKFHEMMQKGIAVGLGTDSTAENNSLDLFRAMYQVTTVHKDVKGLPELIVPEKALEMATIDGARALMWENEIGSLEKGKKADVIIIDVHKPNWIPMHDFSIVPNLVYSGEGVDVTTSIIDGKIVMEKGKILTIDLKPVMEKAQEAGARIEKLLPYRIPSRWKVE
jgi:5-methylthioadenosine/S-adenosylhomocysteine deaminase